MTRGRGIRSAPKRPWRAIAYRPDWTAPNGRRRVVVGRTAAATPAGLLSWKQRQLAAGNVVDVYTVHQLEAVVRP